MRDHYTPPRELDTGVDPDQDEVDALTPRWGVRAAWGTVAASGFLCAIAGVAASSVIAIAGGVWLVFAVTHGMVSLIGALVPFGGVGGAVAAGLAIGPCTRADAARKRLFADGERPLY